jgi:hypothetical protein
MDDASKLTELADIEQYLSLCDRNVANRRAMIEELERGGHDVRDARVVLLELENPRQLYVNDRERLLKELGR